MRSREDILNETRDSNSPTFAYLVCEVLLDIREQNEAILKEIYYVWGKL